MPQSLLCNIVSWRLVRLCEGLHELRTLVLLKHGASRSWTDLCAPSMPRSARTRRARCGTTCLRPPSLCACTAPTARPDWTARCAALAAALGREVPACQPLCRQGLEAAPGRDQWPQAGTVQGTLICCLRQQTCTMCACRPASTCGRHPLGSVAHAGDRPGTRPVRTDPALP